MIKFGFQGIMRMNHLKPPFDSMKVRQAVARAIDRSLKAAWSRRPAIPKVCPAMFVCGMRWKAMTARPSMMWPPPGDAKESGVDLSKPVVMLHVANAPGIAALGNVTRQVLVDLGFKVDMQAMDFQTFATRRLNTKPVAEGGWNIAHTTNTVPTRAARSAIPSGGRRTSRRPPGAGRPIRGSRSCG